MNETRCEVDIAAIVEGIYGEAGRLAASLTPAELREQADYLRALLDARCDEEIAAGRGGQEAPADIEELYNRMVVTDYAIIEAERSKA